MNAYIYFVSKGCTNLWGTPGNGYSTLNLGDAISGQYNFGNNYGSISLYEKELKYTVNMGKVLLYL